MSEYIGKWPLGYTEAGSFEDGLLGVKYSTVVDEKVAGSSLLQNVEPNEVELKWVKNTGAAALVPGTACQVDAAGNLAWSVKTGAVGVKGCGIVDPRLTANVPIGTKFLIVTKGICPVKIDGSYAKGAAIGVGALGVLTTNALSTVAELKHSVGILHESSAAFATRLIKAEVNFQVN